MSTVQITTFLQQQIEIVGSKKKTVKGHDFFSFEGIPYAEPPVGNLRFKAPIAKKWSTNKFDATNNYIECTQFDMTNRETIGQEDCLVLNVYTQQLQGKQPVLVYIHGGAFNDGSGIMHGPRKFLDHNIVLVTINYRLHIFGFLSTMDEYSPGNYGLLDQILALEWIQGNIQRFGGDPNDITVMGQSAGAGCVMHLLLSPRAEGLYHKAIVMSGCSISPWSIKPNPKYWAEKIGQTLGFTGSNSSELVEFLRQIPADVLTKIQKTFIKENYIPMNPVLNEEIFPDHPLTLLKKGLIVNKVPILTGVTRDEGISFLPLFASNKNQLSNETLASTLRFLTEVDYVSEKALELVRNEYFQSVDPEDEKAVLWGLTKLIGDIEMNVGHYQSTNLLLNAGMRLFLYSYDYQQDYSLAITRGITAIKGVGHIDDLFSFFDCPKLFPQHYQIPNDSSEDEFLEIWTHFIKHGYPANNTQSGMKRWTSASRDKFLVYHLNNTITTEVLEPQEIERKIDFWKNKYPAALRET